MSTMTPQQIREAIAARPDLQALVALGNHEAVAQALTASQQNITRSLRVHEVFDVLFENGDYLTLKQAELASDPRAVMAFAALNDARSLGPGTVNLTLPATAQMLDALQAAPALITQASRDALAAASTARPDPIPHEAVTAAVRGAQ